MDSATTSLQGKHSIDSLTVRPNDKKKVRVGSIIAGTTASTPIAAFERKTSPPTPRSSQTVEAAVARKACAFEALPTVAITHVGSFASESSLSGAFKSTLEALPRLHYKVDMWGDTLAFGPDADPPNDEEKTHLGLQASGALATGRVVTRITINRVRSSSHFKNDAGYLALERAVKRVVGHSINTLREITISGGAKRGDGRANGVARILGALVPLSRKQQRVAPHLARVHLVAGATGVAKAGKAIAAGMWPSIEVLTFSHCRANAGHFEDLAFGLSVGLAPRLRVLCWDDQSEVREKPVDDVILAALSRGQCPLIERLSFTGNYFCPEYRMEYLFGALRGCPRLRELRMDCSRTPNVQMRDLARALRAGHAPRLEELYVRATAPHYRDSDVELKVLRQAAASREPPVEVKAVIQPRSHYWRP